MRADHQMAHSIGILLILASLVATDRAFAESHVEGSPSQLGIHGLSFEGELLYDATTFMGGGPSIAGDGLHRGLLTLGAALSLEEAFGWHGLETFVSWQWYAGDNGSEFAGDGQGFSNIDSENSQRVAELWVEQGFGQGLLKLKVGSIDANADLAFVENDGVFLNSSFGLSPSVDGLATYPAAAPGVQLRLESAQGHAFAGVFSSCSSPDRVCWEMRDPMALGQLGRHFGRVGPLHGLRFDLGGWARFEEGEEKTADEPRPWGFYFLSDARLVEGVEDRGLFLFAMGGYAEAGPEAVGRHLGGGFEWRGPFAARPADGLGLALTSARFALEVESGAATQWGWESAVEFFYRLQLTENFNLQPDVQFVLQPAGGDASRNLAAFTLRVAASF